MARNQCPIASLRDDSGSGELVTDSERAHSIGSKELVQVRPYKRDNLAKPLPPLSQAGGLNRLDDAAQLHTQDLSL